MALTGLGVGVRVRVRVGVRVRVEVMGRNPVLNLDHLPIPPRSLTDNWYSLSC